MEFEAINYKFKFRVGLKTLCQVSFNLNAKRDTLVDINEPPIDLPEFDISNNELDGVLLRDVHIKPNLQKLEIAKSIRYIPHFYNHCYIDLSTNFDSYKQKFSSKSLSTTKRKINKFKNNGVIDFRTYKTVAEIENFFEKAIPLSKLTYQEKLLDAGLPTDEAFMLNSKMLAEKDSVRAYLLFKDNVAVAYLFCPANEGTLQYSYLGYNPDFSQFSPGTVLQWLALESIYSEQKFKIFDFTEGDSWHKKHFATHTKLCADVFFFKKTFKAYFSVLSHYAFELALSSLKKILGK